jgi:hypothetical protein
MIPSPHSEVELDAALWDPHAVPFLGLTNPESLPTKRS